MKSRYWSFSHLLNINLTTWMKWSNLLWRFGLCLNTLVKLCFEVYKIQDLEAFKNPLEYILPQLPPPHGAFLSRFLFSSTSDFLDVLYLFWDTEFGTHFCWWFLSFQIISCYRITVQKSVRFMTFPLILFLDNILFCFIL